MHECRLIGVKGFLLIWVVFALCHRRGKSVRKIKVLLARKQGWGGKGYSVCTPSSVSTAVAGRFERALTLNHIQLQGDKFIHCVVRTTSCLGAPLSLVSKQGSFYSFQAVPSGDNT
jgi:hypothetical protein